MRISKTLMTGAVAAVAVAGSANASVVVDPFTAAQSVTSSKNTNGSGQEQNSAPSVSGSWLGFTTRELTASNGSSSSSTTASATTSIGSGAWTLSVSGAPTFKFAEAAYCSGVDLNFSDYTSWTFNLAFNGNRSLSDVNFISLGFGDSTLDANFVQLAESTAGSASTLSVTFNKADFDNYVGFVDWSKITSMSVRIQLAGNSSATAVTVTGFTATVVPAPGAIALLGAAGLVGTRRRR
jgi:hypothetical protein